jgi:transcriptional regulator with XRE-family HTH domain
MEKENHLMQLAISIRTQRLSKNLSQEELASRCGFDRTYISLLERAKRNPSYLNLKKLSIGLEVKLAELLKEI